MEGHDEPTVSPMERTEKALPAAFNQDSPVVTLPCYPYGDSAEKDNCPHYSYPSLLSYLIRGRC
jgi:hypothetical protein